MTDVFRIYGMELSPYSVKVRSYFRYKQIPHEWIPRDSNAMAEFQKYAKLPLVPLVVTPEDEGIQDSTPILEKLEARFPEPSIHPEDPVAAFASALLEEFGDEWGNKWMFHLRWARPADQDSGAERLARGMMPGLTDEKYAEFAAGIKDRMVDRVWFVGSNDTTAPQIEASFESAMRQLETQLASRPYLFGGRPAFGDFGLWGQVYNAWTDPTAGALLNAGMPNVVAWIERMLEPKVEGEFEPWSALEPTLEPLLREQVGGLFLPWSAANAEAIASGAEEFSVELASGSWTQKPQKYHARSLAALRKRYAGLADRTQLDVLLERTGCLEVLRG
jgi:glutathione S-transferase